MRQKSRAADVGQAAASPAVVPTNVCHACARGSEMAPLECTYYGMLFHKLCKRGVETHHRSLEAGDPLGAAVDANVKEMAESADTWRAKQRPFDEGAPRALRMQAHKQAKKEAAASRTSTRS